MAKKSKSICPVLVSGVLLSPSIFSHDRYYIQSDSFSALVKSSGLLDRNVTPLFRFAILCKWCEASTWQQKY